MVRSFRTARASVVPGWGPGWTALVLVLGALLAVALGWRMGAAPRPPASLTSAPRAAGQVLLGREAGTPGRAWVQARPPRRPPQSRVSASELLQASSRLLAGTRGGAGAVPGLQGLPACAGPRLALRTGVSEAAARRPSRALQRGHAADRPDIRTCPLCGPPAHG